MRYRVAVFGVVGLGLWIGPARHGVGQGVAPPPAPPGSGQENYSPPPGAGFGGPVRQGPGLGGQFPIGNLEQLSRQMIEALRGLGDDLAAGQGQSPQAAYLTRDSRELQQAADDWFTATRGAVDPSQLRRTYAGVDVSWHRLRGQLGAPGAVGPAVAEEMRRVDDADAQLHRALGMNAYPPNFDGPTAAPGGLDETRRLAYALAQRGEALAATIQAIDGPDPTLAPIVRDAGQLAQMADAFHDALGDPNQAAQPDFARNTFAQIVQRSNGFGVNLATTPMPPALQAAWDGYTSAHNLLRVNLGLTANTPNGLPPGFDPGAGQVQVQGQVGIPYVANPVAPVAGWANQLDGQVDDLIANFAPTVNVVPEGGAMLDDMQRLRQAAIDFRRDAAQGLDQGRLAFEFREVDEHWRRLARRFERIGRGRTGPNIQRVQEIGRTCDQIHRVLGMPGFAPGFGGY